MAALTFVVSYPLRWLEHGANWIGKTAFAGVGCAAIVIGANLLRNSWAVL
jgi:hypothetical protein